MSRFKRWLIGKFLPATAKESMYKAILFKDKKIEELERENLALKSYCKGLETSLKSIRRITINNRVVK